ncbi:hypothetical protein G9A89_001078 [Geosiphon pyriformis]|nr:hypothetical protein G9A89_001078 [Geosiphon pyriformis]
MFVASESLLVGMAQAKNEPPNSTKLLFLSEFVKLFLSIIFLAIELGCFSTNKTLTRYSKIGKEHQTTGLISLIWQLLKPLLRDLSTVFTSSTTLLFGIPALAYFVNNNLTFIILSMMDPPTFTVLSNLKILTTGFFSYIFLKRQLSSLQWVSLGLLFFGTTVAQINFDTNGSLNLTTSTLGFLLTVVFSSISAGASVFTEFVMKDKFGNESIHLQNIKLYLFGVFFNGSVYFSQSFSSDSGFFSSLRLIHFFIIMVLCSMGLVTSAIIKYAGSITKVYAGSMAMFFSTLVSYFFLNYRPTNWFFAGALMCCLAVHIYSTSSVVKTDHQPSLLSHITDDDDDDYENIIVVADDDQYSRLADYSDKEKAIS